MKKYDVFISYSRKDKKIAKKVHNTLKDANLRVFIDDKDIPATDFPAVLADAILSSKLFLLLASENYYYANFSPDELAFAKTHKPRGCIYCYLIDDAIIPKDYDLLTAAINRRNINLVPIGQELVDDVKKLLEYINTNDQKDKGALIRICADLDCKVFHFNEMIATAKAGDITKIKLPKGKHKLTFEGVENKLDCYSHVQEITDIEYEYYIEVNLLEKYNARKEFEREKYNGHEYVDLGLPSGVKWATCNVGASSPEQYGNYYAWGDISPKEEYDSDNYLSYCNETMDDIGGDKLYDVARESWGDSWRMPTCDECMELKDCCTWERIDQDGKKGCKVTGPNGNSIFLPATGFRRGLSVENKGEIGCYWSSTPDYGSWRECDTISTCSLFFDMYTKGVGYFKDRWFGQSVRPVSDKNFTM